MNHSLPPRTAGSSPRLALLMLAGLAAVGGAAAASAATPDADVPSLAIHYTNQSLASDAGVRDLYRKIVLAAREVCPDVSPSLKFHRQKVVEECRAQAVARAVQQISNPQLAAVHSAKTKNG